MKTCNKCGHVCHCMEPNNEHKMIVECNCDNCECKEKEN